jgi:hypothetical protein
VTSLEKYLFFLLRLLLGLGFGFLALFLLFCLPIFNHIIVSFNSLHFGPLSFDHHRKRERE